MRPVAGYRPFAELARGAAVVYKAYDAERQRTVLLKVLTPEAAEDPALVAWFEGEARAVSEVAHQNVVKLYEAGRDAGRPYLAAEFIDGCALADVLADGPLPASLAAYVVASAARGLAAAHDRGLLHRDIKPGNVLLAFDGQVKLTDFGLATRVGTPEGDGAAGTSVRGTPGYLAPELVRGAEPGPAADIFALGTILIEALTGRPAFPADDAADALDAALHHDPVPSLRADMRVPSGLADVAARLVAKSPADRPAAAADVASILDAHRSQGVGKRAGAVELAAFLDDPAAYRAKLPAQEETRVAQPMRKARTIVAAGATGLAAVVALAWLFTRDSPGRVDPAPPENTGGITIGPLPSNAAREPSAGPAVSEAPPVPTDEPLDGEPSVDQPLPNSATDPPAVGHSEPGADPPAPTASPAQGRLSVAVEPWADVIIDGQSVGTTPLNGPLAVEAGAHRVVLRNPDFPEHAVDVRVGAGETERLAVSLWSLVARISVEVSPWAQVSVNGRDVGTTPLRRPIVLAPGTHTVTFRHPTLGSREEQVDVAAGETRTVRVRMGADTP